jgi:hypothetical protein
MKINSPALCRYGVTAAIMVIVSVSILLIAGNYQQILASFPVKLMQEIANFILAVMIWLCAMFPVFWGIWFLYRPYELWGPDGDPSKYMVAFMIGVTDIMIPILLFAFPEYSRYQISWIWCVPGVMLILMVASYLVYRHISVRVCKLVYGTRETRP